MNSSGKQGQMERGCWLRWSRWKWPPPGFWLCWRTGRVTFKFQGFTARFFHNQRSLYYKCKLQMRISGFSHSESSKLSRRGFVLVWLNVIKENVIDLEGHSVAHLSKRVSDLKQNGTQKRHHFLAQFSISFHMVWSVQLKKRPSETGRGFFDSQSKALKLQVATKWNT